MFYENLIPQNKSKTKTLKFSSFKDSVNSDLDDSCLDFSNSNNVYNFDTTSGALTDGMGIQDVTFKYSSQLHRLTKKVNFPENYQIMGCWYYPYFDTFDSTECPILV